MQILIDCIECFDVCVLEGCVMVFNGLFIEVEGFQVGLSLGVYVMIEILMGLAECEIVGFCGEIVLMMLFGLLEGVCLGVKIFLFFQFVCV